MLLPPGVGKGEVFSLLAALAWACSLVLFQRSGQSVPPLALNLFKNIVGLVLLAATMLIDLPAASAALRVPPADLAILVVSGVIGIAVADTTFFASLNRIGVGLVSIVDCTYSPSVIAFSWLLLGERLSLVQGCGAALVLGGLLVSSRHKSPSGQRPAALMSGILLGVGSMALMALGIVLAKPVLEHHDFPLIPAAVIRLLSGTVVLVLFMSCTSWRGQLRQTITPRRVWLWNIPAAVLGAYLSMIFWIAGFKYTEASRAGILNQTSVIFALILASVFLRERMTARKLVAVMLALVGVVAVLLDEQIVHVWNHVTASWWGARG
jgi:drug/metabolite transporter (DMT)-like permease